MRQSHTGGLFAPPIDDDQGTIPCRQRMKDGVTICDGQIDDSGVCSKCGRARRSLKRYGELFAAIADERIRDQAQELLALLKLFFQTPKSQLQGSPDPTGLNVMVPLEEAEIQRIWDLCPWPDQLDAIGKVLDDLPPGETRNAAFHCKWYAGELAHDREPMTNERLATDK